MEKPPFHQTSKKPLAAIVTILVLAIGGVVALASGVFKNNPAPETQTQNTSDQQTPQDNTQTPPPATVTKYKNGSYDIQGSYRSPGGQEKFQLSITLKDDVITAASFTPAPVSPTGVKMQSQFKAGFQAEVVGKNIDEVSLTVVNGASLTTGGFMQALQSIKQQASVS